MAPAELQHLLTEVVRLGGAPGAAIALSLAGTRTFATAGSATSAAQAPLTPHSRLQLGCIAKLMTAIVALELAAQRRLDLHLPVENYLPELQGTSVGRNVQPRHLMTHTSGYRGPNIADPSVRYYYTWQKLVALLREDEALFDPGTFFNYDHSESVLLGEIIQRITGSDITELHRDMILAPAGIPAPSDEQAERDNVTEHSFDDATRRFVPLRAAPRCAFWRASLSDSTLSLDELLTLTEVAAGLDPERILRDETVLMLRKAAIGLPACVGGALREQTPSSFGFGCAQYGTDVFGHNGSARGQTCALRFDERSKRVAVVALNAWRAHVRDMLCRKILLGAGNATASGDETPPPDWLFAHTAGRYAGAAGTSAEVCEEGGEVVCTLRTNSARKTARLVVSRTEDGRMQLASDLPQLTLGFSRPDAPGPRLMMAGLNAYRRVG